MRRRLLSALGVLLPVAASAQLLGDPVDVAQDFQRVDQLYFVPARVVRFDQATGRGALQWERHVRQPGLNFNKLDAGFTRAPASEFPGTEYDRDPALPFAIEFVSPRALRLRFSTRDMPLESMSDSASPMLAGPVPRDGSWRVEAGDSVITWTSAHGRVRL